MFVSFCGFFVFVVQEISRASRLPKSVVSVGDATTITKWKQLHEL